MVSRMSGTGLTKDLNRSEEVVLVTIALNPDVSGDEMIDQLDTSSKVFSHCVDTLLSRGYVEILEQGDTDNHWRITKLGRLALNKFRVNVKFDLLYASEKDEPDDVIQSLKRKKKRFDAAYKVAKKRAGSEA